MAEQRAFNPLVQGSTPWGRTRTLPSRRGDAHSVCKGVPMGTNLTVERSGDVVTITLNRPETRNSLSRDVMLEMQATLD